MQKTEKEDEEKQSVVYRLELCGLTIRATAARPACGLEGIRKVSVGPLAVRGGVRCQSRRKVESFADPLCSDILWR
jgi:hypothetical protein